MSDSAPTTADTRRLARDAGWRAYVVDPRARFAAPERFPDAEEVIAAWPEEAVSTVERVNRLDLAPLVGELLDLRG